MIHSVTTRSTSQAIPTQSGISVLYRLFSQSRSSVVSAPFSWLAQKVTHPGTLALAVVFVGTLYYIYLIIDRAFLIWKRRELLTQIVQHDNYTLLLDYPTLLRDLIANKDVMNDLKKDKLLAFLLQGTDRFEEKLALFKNFVNLNQEVAHYFSSFDAMKMLLESDPAFPSHVLSIIPPIFTGNSSSKYALWEQSLLWEPLTSISQANRDNEAFMALLKSHGFDFLGWEQQEKRKNNCKLIFEDYLSHPERPENRARIVALLQSEEDVIKANHSTYPELCVYESGPFQYYIPFEAVYTDDPLLARAIRERASRERSSEDVLIINGCCHPAPPPHNPTHAEEFCWALFPSKEAIRSVAKGVPLPQAFSTEDRYSLLKQAPCGFSLWDALLELPEDELNLPLAKQFLDQFLGGEAFYYLRSTLQSPALSIDTCRKYIELFAPSCGGTSQLWRGLLQCADNDRALFFAEEFVNSLKESQSFFLFLTLKFFPISVSIETLKKYVCLFKGKMPSLGLSDCWCDSWCNMRHPSIGEELLSMLGKETFHSCDSHCDLSLVPRHLLCYLAARKDDDSLFTHSSKLDFFQFFIDNGAYVKKDEKVDLLDTLEMMHGKTSAIYALCQHHLPPYPERKQKEIWS